MTTEIKERLQHKTRIEMVYAGGTISSLATPQGHREGGHVVDLVGRLQDRFTDFGDSFDLGEAQVAYTGLSENMDEDYWNSIETSVLGALSKNPNAIIITHGTDSMEQTARYLQRRLTTQLKQRHAKVILTGANEDLSHPRTDAWDNLRFAFESSEADVEDGVYVAFHRKLISADLVVKEPFSGSEMNYVATTDEAYIQSQNTQQQRDQEQAKKVKASLVQEAVVNNVLLYPVNVVRTDHKDFLNQVEQTKPRAVLLRLYHSGTANTEKPELSVAELVIELRARGIVAFGVTENGEPVDLHSYETSVKLREAGVIPLYNMTERVALVKLGMVRAENKTGLIDKMLDDISGEIDTSRIITEDIKQLKELYGQPAE